MLKNCWVKNAVWWLLLLLHIFTKFRCAARAVILFTLTFVKKARIKNIKNTHKIQRIQHLMHVSSTLLLSISVRDLYLYIFMSAAFNLSWVFSTHKSIKRGWRMLLISNLISPVEISRHAISPIYMMLQLNDRY